ncbi:unnamed protein product [Peniophora sp. CBMAI 1063]|nr:unnamed protein product [Peniophora sp. CBMAI 1063]
MTVEPAAADELKPVYRYLPSADKLIIKRHVPTAVMPLVGDFVVFSIDPVASVAHLDKVARQAAKKIRTHRHVGLVMMMQGLPMDDDPVNAFTFAFLRKGLPPTAPPGSFADLCIPALPNTFHPTVTEPLRPIHPLPWDDCYISATDDLGFRNLRVKTTSRDYTPILPLEPEEVWRLTCFIDDSEAVTEERMRRIRRGSLNVIADIPLPESPTSAKPLSLPDPPIMDRAEPPTDGLSVHSLSSSYVQRLNGLSTHDDDASMIGSIDTASSSPGGLPSPCSDDIDVGFIQQFEHFLNNGGSVDDPVVDIWYDLDMVKEVVDISLFLKEIAQIRQVIEDAEERLGIRAARDAAAAELKELRARQAEEAREHTEKSVRRSSGLLSKFSGLLHSTLHVFVCQSAIHDD